MTVKGTCALIDTVGFVCGRSNSLEALLYLLLWILTEGCSSFCDGIKLDEVLRTTTLYHNTLPYGLLSSW